MEAVFLGALNRSITAGWLVLAVVVLRLLLKKAPKRITCLLWALVAIRLVCPFSYESALSLIPSAETVSPEILYTRSPTIQTGIPALNSAVNPLILQSFTPAVGVSANPLQIWTFLASVLWLMGIAAMLLYTLISYIRLQRRVQTAVLLRENIWQSEYVTSPFVLGIICPRIYLPFGMSEEDMTHVIAHEQTHIRRRDHWWKPLGFFLLIVYWFNPLLWMAYVLLCRDIELACDERVIRDLGGEARADYSATLLKCSVSRSSIAACPLAFGEVGVKQRVKNVLNYKKPAFWVILVAVIAGLSVAVCFLTDPAAPKIADGNFTLGDTFSFTLEPSETAYYPPEITLQDDSSPLQYTLTYSPSDLRVEFGLMAEDDGTEYLTESVGGRAIGRIRDVPAGKYRVFIRSSEKNLEYSVTAKSLTIEGNMAFDFAGTIDDTQQKARSLDAAITAAVLEENRDAHISAGEFACESHAILATEAGGPADSNQTDTMTVYALVLYQRYTYADGELAESSGSYIPTALTFDVSVSGEYMLREYWIPRDGSYYADDIREKFPGSSAQDALDDQKYIELLQKDCDTQAQTYFSGADVAAETK